MVDVFWRVCFGGSVFGGVGWKGGWVDGWLVGRGQWGVAARAGQGGRGARAGGRGVGRGSGRAGATVGRAKGVGVGGEQATRLPPPSPWSGPQLPRIATPQTIGLTH